MAEKITGYTPAVALAATVTTAVPLVKPLSVEFTVTMVGAREVNAIEDMLHPTWLGVERMDAETETVPPGTSAVLPDVTAPDR
jgi:hypothetical protein